MLVRGEVAVYINHIILGIVLIIDGVMRAISATSAKNTTTFKNYRLSMVLSVLSVVLGVMLLFLTEKTGVFTMQAVAVIMIVKALFEFYIAFRNRAVLSSINNTIAQIKQKTNKPED